MALYYLYFLVLRPLKKDKIDWGLEVQRKYTGLCMMLFGTKHSKEGRPYNGTALYVGNHRSLLDPVVVRHYIKALGVAKAEIAGYPVLGKAVAATGVVFVNRTDKNSRAHAKDAIVESLKSGRSVLLFPEGTVSGETTTLPFKKGSFEKAVEANVPVVPFTLIYNHPKYHWYNISTMKYYFNSFGWYTPDVHLIIGEPIHEKTAEAMMNKARHVIDTNLLKGRPSQSSSDFNFFIFDRFKLDHMDTMISRFPDQLREAVGIGQRATIKKSEQSIRNIYVAGMGGSGIGGNFVAELVRHVCPVPFIVGKSYDIPGFIDKHTLAILSSYSGNTEETLAALQQMEIQGSQIVCISSGGELINRARKNNYNYIVLPDNWSSPRACLGYSLVQQLYILQKLDLIQGDFEDEILSSADLLDQNIEDIKRKAKEVAAAIQSKTPIIYSVDRFEPVAIRLRQQLNENAKILCWHHVLPEMNHNELVGWKRNNKDTVVIAIRSHDEFVRTAKRFDIIKEIISPLTGGWIELNGKGVSRLEQYMYLVHLADWTSFYLSELNEVDPIEIRVIDRLKLELSKLN